MKNYGILNYYTDLTSLRPVFLTFEELTLRYLPKVAKVLKGFGLCPEIYATSWFIAFYIVVLPFNTVLRIMDIFLLEGYKIIYRVALAILKLKKKKLLKAKDLEAAMLELKDFSQEEWKNEDLIIKTAVSFKFSKKGVKNIEEKQRKSIKVNEK